MADFSVEGVLTADASGYVGAFDAAGRATEGLQGKLSGASAGVRGAFDDMIGSAQRWAGLSEGALDSVATAAGAAVGAIAAATLAAGTQYQTAAVEIERQTGAIGAQAAGLERSFQNVFPSVTQGAKETGAAIAELAIQTDASGAELESIATKLGNLATVTGTSYATAVRTATDVQDAWNLSTQQTSAAAESLFHAQQLSGVGYAALGEAVSQNAALFKAFNLDLEQSIALLASLGKQGLEPAAVFTALRTAFQQLRAAGVEDLGAGLQTVFQEIREAKDPTDATAIAVEFFGERVGAKLVEPIRTGTDELGKFLEKMREMPSSINQTAQNTETLGEAFARFGHELAASPLGNVGRALLDLGVGMLHPIQSAHDLYNATKELDASLRDTADHAAGLPGRFDMTDVSMAHLANTAGSAWKQVVGFKDVVADTAASTSTLDSAMAAEGAQFNVVSGEYSNAAARLADVQASAEALQQSTAQNPLVIHVETQTEDAATQLKVFNTELAALFPNDKHIVAAVAKAEVDKQGLLDSIDQAMNLAREKLTGSKLDAVLTALLDERSRVETEAALDNLARPRTVSINPSGGHGAPSGGGGPFGGGFGGGWPGPGQVMGPSGSPIPEALGSLSTDALRGLGYGPRPDYSSLSTAGLEQALANPKSVDIGASGQVNIEALVHGSPTLPFSDYFTSYAPGVLGAMASGAPAINFGSNLSTIIAQSTDWSRKFGDSMLPTGAFNLLSQGRSADPSQVLQALIQANEIKRYFDWANTPGSKLMPMMANDASGFMYPSAEDQARAWSGIAAQLQALLRATQDGNNIAQSQVAATSQLANGLSGIGGMSSPGFLSPKRAALTGVRTLVFG